MGKGLSPLQKSILQLAFKVSPKRGMTKGDVLEQIWGWEPAPPDHRFASELVGGKKKYQSVHASTSRSIRRLRERELIVWKVGRHSDAGYRITPKGKKVWLAIKEKIE